MALTIKDIIPKMTDSNFKKILRDIGILSYEVVSARSMILFGSSKSRSDRQEALRSLADVLKPYGASYVKESSASGAGYIGVGQAKIMLKPTKVAGNLILKPGLFGDSRNKIIDKDIPYKSYYSLLINSINTTDKLDDSQKEVLIALTEDAAGSTTASKSKVKKVMKSLGQTLSLSTINNDFGEVLGPLAVMTQRLLPIDSRSAIVRIPGRSNEPLLDYKITDKNREYKISAKSGNTTNTLKPSDVVSLIEDNNLTNKNFLYKKWKNTPQYALLKILDSGSTKQGPIDAGMWLKKNGYASYFSWLKKSDYTEEIRQKAETAIVLISREALDFTEIFSDSVTSKVYYIKFKMSATGDIEWKLVETSQDKKESKKTLKRVTFRSKNFVGRPKDKLGFQV